MEVRYCTRCVLPSTRPRATFNEEGVCNACQFHERKKGFDWNAKWKELEAICDEYRSSDGSFDVIVPVSGGKNSSYVAWRLKHDLGMHPLCVNIRSNMQSVVGDYNLREFAGSGFDLMEIDPDKTFRKKLAKAAFIKHGRPQIDFLFAITAMPLRISLAFKIPFIMWGEDAESEHGGSSELEGKARFNVAQARRLYHNNLNAETIVDGEANSSQLYWFTLPKRTEFEAAGIFATHWSYFENWDEYKQLELAKEKCGFKGMGNVPAGTYQKDWHLAENTIYGLHMYLAYMKFGFGRATPDACADIRAGKLTREEAVAIVNSIDCDFPKEHLEDYLDFYSMNAKEFWSTIESFRNPKVWKKVNGEWVKRFELH